MPYGDLLFERLRSANRDELDALLPVLKLKPLEFKTASDEDRISAISKELRSAAGNSLRNIPRGDHDLPCRRVLIDVADKLAPGRWSWSPFKMDSKEPDTEIEDYIYEHYNRLMQERLATMSADDRRKLQQAMEADLKGKGYQQDVITAATSAIGTGVIAGAAIGPIVAMALFSTFWTWLVGLTLGEILIGGVLGGGPIGLLLGGLNFAISPSYSKTVPAVLRLVFIRQTRAAEAGLGGGGR